MTSKSLSMLLVSAAFAAATRADIVGSDLSWSLSRFAKIEGDILTVDVPANSAQLGGSAVAMVDMTPIDGQSFSASVRCRGENISKPPEHWNGLKFQFEFRDAVTGEMQYPNTKSRTGTFPEETISVTVVDAGSRLEQAKLTLGLQNSSGKVVFDLSTLRIKSGCDIFPAVNEDWVCQYPANAAPGPLRGCMSPSRRDMVEDDFRDLAAWGATLLRYQMGRSWNAGNDPDAELAAYREWLGGRLDHLDRDILPWAERYGIWVAVDLHSPPGGLTGSDMNMFYVQRWNDAFVEVWRTIARRFRGRRMIYGYDLVNEPKQSDSAPCGYWDTQRRAAEAIREIDPDATIIVESNGYASSSGFSYLSPLAMDNVIYEVHMYEPFAFTHQGVQAGLGPSTYPNEGRGWTRENLARRLAPVLAFQRRHGARVFVGEFSAAAWADGAERYLADLISIFSEYGWDWTYHAFRESPVWDVEKVGPSIPEMVPATEDTPRKRVLLDGLRGVSAEGDYTRVETLDYNGHEGVSFVSYVRNGGSQFYSSRAWAFKFDLSRGYRLRTWLGDGDGGRATVGAMAECLAAEGAIPIAGLNGDCFEESGDAALCSGLLVSDSRLMHPGNSADSPDFCYIAELGDHNLHHGRLDRGPDLPSGAPEQSWQVTARGRKVRNAVRTNACNYPVRGGQINPVGGSAGGAAFPTTIGNAHSRDGYPRVLVGIGTNGVGVATNLVLFLNDCGQPAWSYVFPDEDAYQIMIDEGCSEVGELDGGGSATMWAAAGPDGVFNCPGAATAHGGCVNRPGDGSPRQVACGLFVLPPETRGNAFGVGDGNTYPDMAEALRAAAPGEEVSVLPEALRAAAPDAAAFWFSADAAGNAARGGAWKSRPVIAGGVFSPAPGNAAVFEADKSRAGRLLVEFSLNAFAIAEPENLPELLAGCAADQPAAAIVVSERGTFPCETPYGLVGENGGLAWMELFGAEDVLADRPCRLAAEFDFSGPSPRVSYLAAPARGADMVRLCDLVGTTWFDSPASAEKLAGHVALIGSGAVSRFAGSVDDPLAKLRTMFLVL